jgi:hypothetical protein
MQNDSLFNCESAIPELPTYLNRWISQYIKKIPMKIPLRKNGLTSSGRPKQCHSNVAALVKVFGGQSIKGFLICVNEDMSFLTSHSCWLTPENNLVDVTMSLSSENETHRYFIPYFNRSNEHELASIYLDRFYRKKGILVDFVLSKINFDIAIKTNLQLVKIGLKTAVKIPSSKFDEQMLRSYEMDKNKFDQEIFEKADFSLPSTATGKLWSEYVKSF